MTLPIRLSWRTSVLALRTARAATETAWHVGEQALGAVLPGPFSAPGEADRDTAAGEAPSPSPRPQRTDQLHRDPRRRSEAGEDPRPAATASAAPPSAARETEVDFDTPGPLRREGHVSQESELVEERADPGVENGAGAQIRVAEPWPGYTALAAPDVVARIAVADAAELMAVRMFETANRGRGSVLSAIEDKLRGTPS